MKKILFVIALFLTLVVLFFEAKNNLWSFHGATDIKTFYNRYTQFSSHTSFKDYGQNEYLPGSLFFFLSPSFLGKIDNYEIYLRSFIFINLVLIIFHFILYKIMKPKNINYFSILLFLAIGPILLFRFELFVSIIFLLAIYLFVKKKYLFSGIFIGLAIMIKIYPLFVMPYFLMLLLKNEERSKVFKFLLGIIIGVFIPIVIYTLLGGNLFDPIKNILFNAGKPIGVESLFSSVISLKSLVSINSLPHIDVINGIWGIVGTEKLLLLNYLPYLILFVFYISLFFTIKKGSNFTIYIPIFILFVFLLSSKYLNPQYLFWIFGLFPLIEFKMNFRDVFLASNTIIVLILTQLTFPMYFGMLLDSYSSGAPNILFYVLQTRNIFIILELIILGTYLKRINEDIS